MAVLKIYYEKTAGMDYLYKITVEIDDEKVLSLQQHDLDAVYKTVREAFAGCNFKEVPTDNKRLAFVIGDGSDSFSEVGIVANALHDSWLGKYLTALRICSEKYKNLTTNTANKFNGEHYENRTCA